VGAFVRCIVLVVLGAVLARAGRPPVDDASEKHELSGDHDSDAEEIAIFVYDAVTRVNEGLVGNIDAIDTALTAILAGALAGVLFAADKLSYVPPGLGVCALVLLGCAAAMCAVGYFVGALSGIRKRDGMRPHNFIADIAKHPGLALTGAIRAQMESGEANMTIRLYKRVAALIAVLLLIAGVISVAIARWTMIVVY
jgi:hypothetical protein